MVDWGAIKAEHQQLMLCDAQTSGGLLISLPEKEARKFLTDIRNAGCPKAEIIGSILPVSETAMQIR